MIKVETLLKDRTDQAKKNYLMRHFNKYYLFLVCEGCIEDLNKIKTKKELIEKHLDRVWELVSEECSHTYEVSKIKNKGKK